MKKCRFCQQEIPSQGGNWMYCFKCQYWVKTEEDDKILFEVFRCSYQYNVYDLTIDYMRNTSHIETLFGDILWQANILLSVTPDSAVDKIKFILAFL